MRFLKAVFALVVIWVLSVLTVYVLKGWGPIEGTFKYTGQGAYLTAGGLLAAVVIMLLVLVYVLGKILEWAKAGALGQAFQTPLIRLFGGW